MNKKTIIISSAAIIAVGIGAATYINFSVAKRPLANASLDVNGTKEVVSADKKSDLGFERSGKITFIVKKIGDSVAEGEVLAKIDDAEAKTQYAQARAGVLVAQADLASLENLLKKAKLELKGLGSNDRKIQNKQIDSAENNVDSQRARVLQATENSANVKNQLDKCVLKAPFAGTITRQDMALGEIVNPNVSVITIAQSNN